MLRPFFKLNTKNLCLKWIDKKIIATLLTNIMLITTVVPAKSDSDVIFCLQSYQGLSIDRSFVY